MGDIIQNMPIEVYHAHPAVSKSGLDLIAKSPLHFWHEKLNPDKEPDPPREHFVIGQAFHTLLMEPKEFEDRFYVWSGAPRNTKAGKEEYAQAEIDAAGRDLLKEAEKDDLKAMAKAVRNHPGAMRLLDASGKVENSIFWQDAETQTSCRCRPDFLRDDGLIVDIKTAADASPEGFMKAAYDHRYGVQAAFYSEGVREAGIEPAGFAFIVVEKKAPYCVATYSTSDDMHLLGEYLMRRNLETYRMCVRANKWPGYGGTIQPLGIPPWAQKILKEGMEQ